MTSPQLDAHVMRRTTPPNKPLYTVICGMPTREQLKATLDGSFLFIVVFAHNNAKASVGTCRRVLRYINSLSCQNTQYNEIKYRVSMQLLGKPESELAKEKILADFSEKLNGRSTDSWFPSAGAA